jgi:hypothetical protein
MKVTGTKDPAPLLPFPLLGAMKQSGIPPRPVPWSLVACTLVACFLVACYFGCAYTSFNCLVAWNLIASLLFSSLMSVWSCHLCLVALAIWTFLVLSFQRGIQIWSQICSSTSRTRVISLQKFQRFLSSKLGTWGPHIGSNCLARWS